MSNPVDLTTTGEFQPPSGGAPPVAQDAFAECKKWEKLGAEPPMDELIAELRHDLRTGT